MSGKIGDLLEERLWDFSLETLINVEHRKRKSRTNVMSPSKK